MHVCVWPSQAVITYLIAHRRSKRAGALGWAAGGRQVQQKINAICKVPSTQFQRWIVSSSVSRGENATRRRRKVMTQLNFGKTPSLFHFDCQPMTRANGQEENEAERSASSRLSHGMHGGEYISTCCRRGGQPSGHSGTAGLIPSHMFYYKPQTVNCCSTPALPQRVNLFKIYRCPHVCCERAQGVICIEHLILPCDSQ